MYERGRSFDGWDVVFFVVGGFGAALVMAFVWRDAATFGRFNATLMGGGAALALRNAVLPRKRGVVPLKAPVATKRSLMGAVCLGVGLVLSIFSGTGLVLAIGFTLSERQPIGFVPIAICSVPLVIGIVLLRLGFRADRGR